MLTVSLASRLCNRQDATFLIVLFLSLCFCSFCYIEIKIRNCFRSNDCFLGCSNWQGKKILLCFGATDVIVCQASFWFDRPFWPVHSVWSKRKFWRCYQQRWQWAEWYQKWNLKKEGWGHHKCKMNVCMLLVGLSSSSLVKMCLFQLLSGRLRHVTSTVTFSVQQRLKPSHHVMICQLLPRFHAPRYQSIKMHDHLLSKKSERYVVFYSQQVDARKHQESSSTFVWCTWHIWRQWIGISAETTSPSALGTQEH